MACTRISTASCRLSADGGERRYRLAVFDLQLFNQEKTEEATPKRKQEARQRGQVAKSTEISTAFVILTAFLALKLLSPYMYDTISSYMRFIFTNLATADFTINSVHLLFLQLGLVCLKIVLPVMLSVLVISLAVNILQVGFVLTFEPLMPQLDRINPIKGFQRLFSLRSIVELFKSLFKIGIISYFVYRFVIKETDLVPQLISVDLLDTLRYIAGLVADLALEIGAVILVLAAMDYFYQWWEHNKGLRMSKQEVKEEFKQTEGNPQIKGKIKERQRAMALRRMMQEVPKATAVITNPTHFAVAIKYDKSMAAPEVVAKGQDFLAERIKQVARENRVAIVENKPLARTLYSTVEVGEPIPPELYQAVAEVLAYIIRLKRRLS
ncbi:flagellar biosynthesis protein FlhB [Anaeroselena agilis]|uniref:Flagellar biosynthetic protein FlhB n=1 Tax=Anaeroselena agilis TaxID=3063788 RepID=A0ABU3NWV7_9FIRM|nr:flagellar biosynthesis protein FlhB [Selenomonadales bacterium 4137-cl]